MFSFPTTCRRAGKDIGTVLYDGQRLPLPAKAPVNYRYQPKSHQTRPCAQQPKSESFKADATCLYSAQVACARLVAVTEKSLSEMNEKLIGAANDIKNSQQACPVAARPDIFGAFVSE